MKEGSFSIVFTMLEILSADRMKELLKEQLLAKGFNESRQGLEMPVKNGQSAVFDLANMSMELKVPLPDKCTVLVQEEYIADFRKKLNEAVEQGTVLDNWMIERQIDNLKSSAIAKLRELAVEARKEVNSALKEVYRTAVKEKAATMGNVENVSESKEGNTYRIRIEITD
jgi:hypothetical protein